MQTYLFLAPTSIDKGGSSNQNLSFGPWAWPNKRVCIFQHRTRISASAIGGGLQNYYTVLGVPHNASSADIKKAYRLLALKYHPDVSKDSGAEEVFKKIHLAYDVLSNESSRSQYDQALRHQDNSDRPLGGDWEYEYEYDDVIRTYRWADLRRKMRRERYWERYQYHTSENFSSYYDKDEESEEETPDEERGPFTEVLRSAFLSLFLMYTIGIRLSLTFSSLMALLDRKLDAGYKIGYLLAWILGGRGGILLTLCLSFASWLCGKTSSSVVVLVVIAMWVGSNVARYAPLPQGAILTLLYLSIKLQVDLS
ncbi:uncharacterized protein [Nicotiana tomentosiformis]|uniref:J domain-containing protein n=1 Tax=Nicotiana tabacum TaxID=4097 RepID=A0A1S3XAR6_TOBAC|nr:uncharacterized protein LOC104095362 [Nicotiana tomentosiformis]XP_016436858.1 PREDICTED: uncharacterized protein LOC107762969 [Nicotiana tabacum]